MSPALDNGIHKARVVLTDTLRSSQYLESPVQVAPPRNFTSKDVESSERG